MKQYSIVFDHPTENLFALFTVPAEDVPMRLFELRSINSHYRSPAIVYTSFVLDTKVNDSTLPFPLADIKTHFYAIVWPQWKLVLL